MRLLSLLACLTICAALSTACSSAPEAPPPRVKVERLQVDQAALQCRQRPAPLGPDATYQALLDLVGEAIDWGGDCESRLATVAAIVAPPPAPVPPAPPSNRSAAARPPAVAWVVPRAQPP